MRTKWKAVSTAVLSCTFAIAASLPSPVFAQTSTNASDTATIARETPPRPAAAPRVPRRQGTAPFMGLYVGAVFGMAKAKADASASFGGTNYFADSSDDAIEALNPLKAEPSKALFGGTVGFNGQAGAAVVGVEGDFTILKLDDPISAGDEYPCCGPTAFTVTQNLMSDWLMTARVRAGGAVGPALIYGTGGFAMAKLKFASAFADDFAEASATADFEETRKGFVFGGGVEFKAGPHVSIKGEFLRVNLGDIEPYSSTNFTSDFGASPDEVFTNDFKKIVMNIFRVGVNVGF